MQNNRYNHKKNGSKKRNKRSHFPAGSSLRPVFRDHAKIQPSKDHEAGTEKGYRKKIRRIIAIENSK